MRGSPLRLSLVIGIVLSVAGCETSPPPVGPNDKASTTLPEGFTKTKKGRLKGKMTHEARKQILGAGLEE